MKIGDEVYVHGYVDEIRQGVVIIRNNGGYFGTVAEEVLLTGIEHIADRKTEPIDKDINVRSKTEPQTYVINPQEPTNDNKCFDCEDFFTCGGQCNKIEDEPQTDCSWK